MSAYLLDPEKIGKISHIVLDHISEVDRDFLIGVLAVQNVRSIQSRYEDQKSKNYDEVVSFWINDSKVETFKDYLISAKEVSYTEAPAALDDRLALLSEYCYQSCETDDWEETLSCCVLKETNRLLTTSQGITHLADIIS